MEEANHELSTVLRTDCFRIIDPRVLTAQEHKLIGSTPEFDPKTHSPFKPQSFFSNSVPLEETLRIRKEQGFIVSHSASTYFGFEGDGILQYAVVIELSEIDSVKGEVVDRLPKLVGIYDAESRSVITDPKILEKHPLTELGRQRLLFREQPSSV